MICSPLLQRAICKTLGNESQNRQKSILAWCMIYCSLNNLHDKANTREAGKGELTLRLAIHVLQIN